MKMHNHVKHKYFKCCNPNLKLTLIIIAHILKKDIFLLSCFQMYKNMANYVCMQLQYVCALARVQNKKFDTVATLPVAM